MNTQVVLCPEWNDGQELDRTISDLSAYYPAVRTLSIVPVGLTKHRRGLHKMRSCTAEEAKQVIDQVDVWQARLRTRLHASFVHAADEFYVLADSDVPPSARYDEFGQTENGVGVIRIFLDELDEIWSQVPRKAASSRHVAVVTGVSARRTIERSLHRLKDVSGLTTQVIPVVNEFYGHNVTVAGLLTGQDIIEQVKPQVHPDTTVLLPDIMLKDDEDVFLDDRSVAQVQAELGCSVHVVPATATGLIYGALGYTSTLPPRRRYETTLRPMQSIERGIG